MVTGTNKNSDIPTPETARKFKCLTPGPKRSIKIPPYAPPPPPPPGRLDIDRCIICRVLQGFEYPSVRKARTQRLQGVRVYSLFPEQFRFRLFRTVSPYATVCVPLGFRVGLSYAPYAFTVEVPKSPSVFPFVTTCVPRDFPLTFPCFF